LPPEDVRVGCSGSNYPQWREVVYLKSLPQSRWLEHHATLFGSVKVNSTFYRLPKRESVARWVAQTPDDFVFRGQERALAEKTLAEPRVTFDTRPRSTQETNPGEGRQ
jgi:Protein of unknown function DUF72